MKWECATLASWARAMMNCLKCGAQIDLAGKQCSKCGTQIDADGDGVPDALGKMIEDKARAMLVAEKERERYEAAQAAALAAGEAKAKEEEAARAERQQTLEELYRERDADANKPRRIWVVNTFVLGLIFVVALVFGAAFLPGCAEPIAGRPIIAGNLMCSSVCSSCRGPAKIFTWHTSGGSYEGNVSIQFCHNGNVDLEKLTWMNVSDEDDKPGALAPYRLSMWWNVLINFAFTFLVLFAIGPFIAGRIRTRWLTNAQIVRDQRIITLEQLLKRNATPPDPTVPYRSYRS